MKTYKVLEAHQGDKFYVPDDPVTGTRIADPNAVAHLVTLGLLEEAGDAPDPVLVDEAGASVVDLQAQVEALTQERDQARADLANAHDRQQAVEDDLVDARQQVETLTQEVASLREAAKEAGGDPVDHDGNGQPGGSKPRGGRKAG